MVRVFGLVFHCFQNEVSLATHGTGHRAWLGVASSCLPLYYCFGPDLWNAGWKQGQSVILFSVTLVILSAVYTLYLSRTNPDVMRRSGVRDGGE